MTRTYTVCLTNTRMNDGTYDFPDIGALIEFVALARNMKWGILNIRYSHARDNITITMSEYIDCFHVPYQTINEYQEVRNDRDDNTGIRAFDMVCFGPITHPDIAIKHIME